MTKQIILFTWNHNEWKKELGRDENSSVSDSDFSTDGLILQILYIGIMPLYPT